MARLIHGLAETPAPRRADPLTNLTLLLSRLQRTIVHADADRETRLKESAFEREKARQNIGYARSLLAKLEQEALAVKAHARRQEAQADLARKREVLDHVAERLSDLAELAAAEHSADGAPWDDEDATSDGEDILADIIVTPSESMDSTRSPDMPPAELHEPSEQTPEPLEPPSPPPPQPQDGREKATTPQPELPPSPPPPPTTTTTTTTTQTLRPRHPEPTSLPTSAPAPATATTTSSLYGNRGTTSATPETTALSTTEAILDHQRAEQDALSESILRLASELKASSHAFSASLDEDKELVDRAAHGMDRTGQTMEGVTRRLGMLTRMTEGEGWWGRVKLYAIVYGLMVVLVLVVAVLPKLRF